MVKRAREIAERCENRARRKTREETGREAVPLRTFAFSHGYLARPLDYPEKGLLKQSTLKMNNVTGTYLFATFANKNYFGFDENHNSKQINCHAKRPRTGKHVQRNNG